MIEKSIGQRIQQHRKAKGLTQEQLAEKLGCTPNHISAIERGFYGPKLEFLVHIMNILECSADDIFVDVLNSGYRIRSAQLSDRLEKLNPDERERILDVLETMLKHAEQ